LTFAIRFATPAIRRNETSPNGFRRFNPAQFVHFLDIARASATETKALLKKGLAIGSWQAPECGRLEVLADRGLQAVAKLQRYLRSSQAKLHAARRYRKLPNDPNASNASNASNDPNASNNPND
jgi:hypothetical protein